MIIDSELKRQSLLKVRSGLKGLPNGWHCSEPFDRLLRTIAKFDSSLVAFSYGFAAEIVGA